MKSNLQTAAAASTSSARGLYQFIEQTWLGTVKQAGASFGYGEYADAITKAAVGQLHGQRSPNSRQQILKLRDDPGRQCGDGRSADAVEQLQAGQRHRPAAELTTNSTSRISLASAAPRS